MVLDVDARNAVACGGHDEGVIEADLERSGLDFPVPIDRARSQAHVPFADGPRPVACRFQHGWQRGPSWFDEQRRVAREHAGSLLAPRIFACHQRVPRRRAGGRRRVGGGTSHALGGQAVQIGCFDFRCPVAA